MRSFFTLYSLLAVAVTATLAYLQADGYPLFGNRDFIEYWCAYHLARTGQNPYDSSLLFTFQRSIGWSEPAALMMWNPPWLMTVLSPILSFPFYESARLFIVLNVTLIAVTTAFSWKLLASRPDVRVPEIALLATLLFFPVKLAIDMGQVSVIITAALVVGLWALRVRRDLLAGALLSLLTIKPHLAYLPLLLATWVVIRERRWRVVVSGIGTLALLFLGTAVLFPGTIGFWRETLKHGAAGDQTIPVVAWQVSSLVGATRAFVASTDIRVHQLIMVLIPGITAAVFLWWLVFVSRPQQWWSILPWLLPLSMFTAPFGWLFDHTIALPTQLATVAILLQCPMPIRSRVAAVLALLWLNALVPIQLKFGLTMHHHFFWFPAVLLAIYASTRASTTEALSRKQTPRS